MNLAKQNWTLQDGYDLVNIIQSLGKPNRVEWSRKIVNTNMQLFAVPTPELKKLAKQILQGNVFSFLELKLFECYETVVLYGMVLSTLEFEELLPYLTTYLQVADSWAHCDLLSFATINKQSNQFVALSQKWIGSTNKWQRRTALIILLQLCKQPQFLRTIFKTLDNLQQEQEYYVNMAGAWLLCECFVKHEVQTQNYFATHHTNKFIINKGISKCRDSFRVTPANKQMLLQYKVK